MEGSPSRTAMFAATERGRHRMFEAPPWLLDDPLALVLVGPTWRDLAEVLDSLLPGDHLRQVRTGAALRSRYAEDRLVEGGFSQYVILGAGLDSFAWRRPDLLGTLRLFEVDHPASQAWKLQRIAELGLPDSDRQVFVPVDFEVDSLLEALDGAGLDRTRPTLFSWLGVVMYLTDDAVATTLRSIAACAPGSEVALSYRGDDSALDDTGRKILDTLMPLVDQLGESFQDGRSAQEMEALVGSCGLQVVDHPTRADLANRYLSGRTDGLMTWSPECLLVAAVSGSDQTSPRPIGRRQFQGGSGSPLD